jgi:hypothetical protein
MGTPFRSKTFHDVWYGDMGDNGLIDHVGIYGHSTLLLIDALIKHNKDFDMLALANRNHGYSSDRLQDRGSTRLGGARPRDRQLTLESGIFRS